MNGFIRRGSLAAIAAVVAVGALAGARERGHPHRILQRCDDGAITQPVRPLG